MTNPLTSYPPPTLEQVRAALPTVLARMNGQVVQSPTVVAAACTVECFILSLLFPTDQAPCTVVTVPADIAAMCQTLLVANGRSFAPVPDPAAFPWREVLDVLFMMLQLLLA